MKTMVMEDLEAFELHQNHTLPGPKPKLKDILQWVTNLFTPNAIPYYYQTTQWLCCITSDTWNNIIFHLIKLPNKMEYNSSC